jgi:hypothetical protein
MHWDERAIMRHRKSVPISANSHSLNFQLHIKAAALWPFLSAEHVLTIAWMQ